jgi:hypothetical protein
VGWKNIPRILVMKKETIIKIINEYFNKMGNKDFVKKYWLDSENLPFKIWKKQLKIMRLLNSS